MQTRVRFGCPREVALEHLLLRLRPVNRALRAMIAKREATARKLHSAGAVGHAITRGHADTLLDTLSSLSLEPRGERSALTQDEQLQEIELRRRASSAGIRLPLDAMVQDLALSELEREVLVLCASVEVDADYETVLAYVHDDPARRLVSIELACSLVSASLEQRTANRIALGPWGRLRRFGLVGHVARETGLRDELRLTAPCADALLGAPVDLAVTFRDPADIALEAPHVLAADQGLVARAAAGLAEQELDVIAVWGRPALTRDLVGAIARDAGLRLRRYLGGSATRAIEGAAALRAALWIDLDDQSEPAPRDLVDVCRSTRVPLIVSGVDPWRPTELLAARRYMEIPVVAPDHLARQQLWQAEVPELESVQTEQTASAFQFTPIEVRAAANVARTFAAIQTNGHAVTAADTLRSACLVVARKHGERHTTLVTPRRRAEDLILPPDLHARVLDLVHNFRALPRVMHEWGFVSRVSGGGLKGLFTGEPGTGKTMAAEVVANELGLPMLRVDLARVVSKWIGETEKNLDQVFNEARDCHAVLFFDEAEALFGARGDVRHGTDRYANLEVSYLLQRFEDHSGVVILATNLRDKIDNAFMRRFHVVVGFPRPSEKERLRIWQGAFTAATPLGEDLDVRTLARLDMTGAGIVAAAQTAALLAARENTPVSMRHVVRGLVRQYQREARVLNAHDLGVHATHASS